MTWEHGARVWLLRRQRKVWVLDRCPQLEGANYDWFVLAAGRGGEVVD